MAQKLLGAYYYAGLVTLNGLIAGSRQIYGQFELNAPFSPTRHVLTQDVFNPQLMSEAPYWKAHFPYAYYLTKLLKPQVVVELGVHHGDSLFAFAQALKHHGSSTYRIVGIDAWEGDIHTGEQHSWIYDRVNALAAPFRDNVELKRNYFEKAVSDFDDGSIDLLHIDGLHTYEAVKADFETYRPKLSERAVVLFHDISVYKQPFGVWKYWNELSATFPHFTQLHSCGLGTLAVGKNLPNDMQQFIDLDESMKQNLAHFFSRQAKSFVDRYLSADDLSRVQRIDSHAPPAIDAFMGQDLKKLIALRW